LFKHFVAFIKNKVLDVSEVERLVSDESKQSSWRSDNNVRAVLLQCLLVLADWQTTEEH